MSKIFKPRRGRASTMAGTKASTVLAAGEFFVELPDTGVGTGPCKIKMGDGSTTYPNLPYALGDEVSDVTITADSSASASAALANVVSGKSLGQLIGSLKQACSKNADAIATLNDDLKYSYKEGTLDGFAIGFSVHSLKNRLYIAYCRGVIEKTYNPGRHRLILHYENVLPKPCRAGSVNLAMEQDGDGGVLYSRFENYEADLYIRNNVNVDVNGLSYSIILLAYN